MGQLPVNIPLEVVLEFPATPALFAEPWCTKWVYGVVFSGGDLEFGGVGEGCAGPAWGAWFPDSRTESFQQLPV